MSKSLIFFQPIHKALHGQVHEPSEYSQIHDTLNSCPLLLCLKVDQKSAGFEFLTVIVEAHSQHVPVWEANEALIFHNQIWFPPGAWSSRINQQLLVWSRGLRFVLWRFFCLHTSHDSFCFLANKLVLILWALRSSAQDAGHSDLESINKRAPIWAGRLL